jgi:hypothetical protein
MYRTCTAAEHIYVPHDERMNHHQSNESIMQTTEVEGVNPFWRLYVLRTTRTGMYTKLLYSGVVEILVELASKYYGTWHP